MTLNRSRRARGHWILKLRNDRFDLDRLTTREPFSQLRQVSIPRLGEDIDAGDDMTLYVAKRGFVTMGQITRPPYLGNGFDPAYALDPIDVVTDHVYVDIDFSFDCYGRPIPWSVLAADPAFRKRMGAPNPVRLTDVEWDCLRRHFVQWLGIGPGTP
jgi:hypothetical protein